MRGPGGLGVVVSAEVKGLGEKGGMGSAPGAAEVGHRSLAQSPLLCITR